MIALPEASNSLESRNEPCLSAEFAVNSACSYLYEGTIMVRSCCYFDAQMLTEKQIEGATSGYAHMVRLGKEGTLECQV